MSAPDPLLGTRIGSIRLEARLGAGAMGVVYRGRHEVLAKDVAVKLLANAKARDVHARERFLREARAAAKISHQNVVSVFEAGLHNEAPYLVMELVVGHSLGSLLDELTRKNGGKPAGLPHAAVSRLGTGIALGIAAIHAAGVVHRDIKPDNIMVAADRTPKVADLGLAKEVADPEAARLTGTGMVVGTPLYCAPEAIRDPQSIGPAADIYSLGASLYHMVAGQPPFLGDTAYAVMRAHLEDRPKPLREAVPGTPNALAVLVDLCLDKDPARRPSAVQVAEALSSGVALKSRPRFGAVAITSLATVALLGSGGAAWWWLAPKPTAPPPVATTALLVLQSNHPLLQVRVDDGQAQDVGPEGVSIASGKHRLEIRARQTGPLLRAAKSIEAAPASKVEVAVELAPVAVPEASLDLPGAGMLYLNGQAYGLEASARVAQAGTWPLARWSGQTFATRVFTVDDRGRVEAGPANSLDRPGGDAWWRSSGDDGLPTVRHHVVCWYEADRCISAAHLSEPGSWREQSLHPAQPAMDLDLQLVPAIVERLGEAALPDHEQALSFCLKLRKPVWSSDGKSRLSLVGGGASGSTGALVIVPRP